MKSNARLIQDWLDLATEQGWRLRETRNGMQLYPPNRVDVITVHDLRRCDDKGTEALRSQLRRAGLQFPSEQKKEKPQVAPASSPVAHVPAAAPEQSVDPFAVIEQKISTVINLVAEIEQAVKQIRADQAKLLQIRALLKEI